MPKAKGRKANNNVQFTQNSARPPSFDPNTRFVTRRRFQVAAGAGQITVTASSIADAQGMVCRVANTTAVGIVAATKIRSVEVWGAMNANASAPVLASSSTIELVWGTDFLATQSAYAPGLAVSDTSTSVALPPHLKATPPRNSNAAFWQNRTTAAGGINNGVTMFTLIAPTGSILDIVCDCVLADQGKGSPLVTTAITSGALGAFAYYFLDGVTSQLTPVGVDTFT